MATATSPVPEDRGPKRQKGDENGSSSQGGPADGSYSSRPPQHPNQMYHGYMGMGGGGPGPYMGGPGVPPYGQYGGTHGHPPHPPPHSGYGGMYGGPRGHGSPERPSRPSGPHPGAPGPWSGYRGPPSSGGGPKKDDKDPTVGPPPNHSYHPGGWGAHPQSWQQGHSYGHPPPAGYGGHPSMPGPGMYGHGGGGPGVGAWNGGQPAHGEPGIPPHGPSPTASGNTGKTPPRSRPRLEAATPVSRPAPPPPPQRPDSSYCLEVSSVPNGRNSVTHDMMNEDGSSVSGSQKDKGRGSYKCGRCGVPKKGHICPYQPKLKRRPDEPPPETRCAAVQVEMDEFMTLRRLNIRIQGFPESYATEPFICASMVGAESRPLESYSDPGMMSMDDRQQDGPLLKDSNHSNHEGSSQKREISVNRNGERDTTEKEEKSEAYV